MTRIVAHRGFAGVNPENTVGAVRAAADAGAAMVELDVVACADGTPVVFHDAHLGSAGGSRGITDGSGAVADLSPDAVTAAEVLDGGERVPTLDRLLDETDVPLNVELKRPVAAPDPRGALPAADRDAARERWQPLVDRTLDCLDGRDVLLSSFYEGALAAVRRRDGTAPLAPICTELGTGRILAARYDAETIHPSLSAVRNVDPAPTDRTVNVWTTRTWHEAREAIRAGADGLIADYPGLTRWFES
ncbi:MAG: glycerophosphodiester phosphodiesterase [Haloplanus sp.]